MSGSPNPLFQRSIDTYGGADYAQTVRAALGLTSRYEWMFWDMALRRERWPLQDRVS